MLTEERIDLLLDSNRSIRHSARSIPRLGLMEFPWMAS